VLPIYPALYVLAGAAALAHWKGAAWLKPAIAVPLLWLATTAFAIAPNHLAYFGPQAGGPSNGYKRLVDSSLDWGMNLPNLKRWLEENNPEECEPLFLAYFGSDSPEHYGIRSTRLPGFFERSNFQRYTLTPGYYAISASLLQGVYTSAFGGWTKHYEQLYRANLAGAQIFDRLATDPLKFSTLVKQTPPEAWMDEFDLLDNLRFARLCAWLRHQGEPSHHVDHAIFIWKLDQADLDAALLGPPAELLNGPGSIRRFRRFHKPRAVN